MTSWSACLSFDRPESWQNFPVANKSYEFDNYRLVCFFFVKSEKFSCQLLASTYMTVKLEIRGWMCVYCSTTLCLGPLCTHQGFPALSSFFSLPVPTRLQCAQITGRFRDGGPVAMALPAALGSVFTFWNRTRLSSARLCSTLRGSADCRSDRSSVLLPRSLKALSHWASGASEASEPVKQANCCFVLWWLVMCFTGPSLWRGCHTPQRIY